MRTKRRKQLGEEKHDMTARLTCGPDGGASVFVRRALREHDGLVRQGGWAAGRYWGSGGWAARAQVRGEGGLARKKGRAGGFFPFFVFYFFFLPLEFNIKHKSSIK